MTDYQHPITPPPELMQQWAAEWHEGSCTQELLEYIATQAARWGADTELEACVEWIKDQNNKGGMWTLSELRAARRPKPPSLKQQALEALEQVDEWAVTSVSQLAIHENLVAGVDTIRRALESLPD